MKKNLLTTGFVAAVAAAGVLASVAYAADGITVVSWGGAYQKAQHDTIFGPYTAKSGTAVKEEEYNGEVAKIRAMVESGTVSWDVISVDTQTALQGCDEGVLETLDYSKILDKGKVLPGAALDCAIGGDVYATVFAYDTAKLPEGPTSIKDLFDLAKFPGKRACRRTRSSIWNGPSLPTASIRARSTTSWAPRPASTAPSEARHHRSAGGVVGSRRAAAAAAR